VEEPVHLPEKDAIIVMNKLLSCIKYLHINCNLAHRDLKLENILLESNQDLNEIKLIDFGLAVRYDPKDATSQNFSDLVGSTAYVAPQVIEGEYSAKCDIWSCGVIAYCLLAGYTPFEAYDDGQMLQQILVGLFDFDDDVWKPITPMAKDFICNLLAYNEEDRPTAEQALRHPWLSGYREELMAKDEVTKKAVDDSIRDSLMGLRRFKTRVLKLKQAACAIMASQLLKKEEKEQFKDGFRILNPSLSGSISKEDLIQSFRVKAGLAFVRDDVIDGIFEEVNFSKSGEISYSEYAIAMMFRKNDIGDEKLKIVFEMLDKNGDGKICANDLKEALNLKDGVGAKMIEQVEGAKGSVNYKQFKDVVVSRRTNSMEDESMGGSHRRGSTTTKTKVVNHKDGRIETMTEITETSRDGTKSKSYSSKFTSGNIPKEAEIIEEEGSMSGAEEEKEEEKVVVKPPAPVPVARKPTPVALPGSLLDKRKRMALKWSSVLNGAAPGALTTETALDKSDHRFAEKKSIVATRSIKTRVNVNLFSSNSKRAPDFDWDSMKDRSLKIASTEERKKIKPAHDWFCLAKNESVSKQDGIKAREEMKRKEEEAIAEKKRKDEEFAARCLENKKKAEAEAEEKRLQEEAEAKKKAEVEAARKAAEEEERRKEEEEARNKAEAEAAASKAAEDEARDKAEAEEAARVAAEEKLRQEEEEEARRKAEAETDAAREAAEEAERLENERLEKERLEKEAQESVSELPAISPPVEKPVRRKTTPPQQRRGSNVYKPAPNMSGGKMKFPKNARRVSTMGDTSARMGDSSARMGDESGRLGESSGRCSMDDSSDDGGGRMGDRSRKTKRRETTKK